MAIKIEDMIEVSRAESYRPDFLATEVVYTIRVKVYHFVEAHGTITTKPEKFYYSCLIEDADVEFKRWTSRPDEAMKRQLTPLLLDHLSDYMDKGYII